MTSRSRIGLPSARQYAQPRPQRRRLMVSASLLMILRPSRFASIAVEDARWRAGRARAGSGSVDSPTDWPNTSVMTCFTRKGQFDHEPKGSRAEAVGRAAAMRKGVFQADLQCR